MRDIGKHSEGKPSLFLCCIIRQKQQVSLASITQATKEQGSFKLTITKSQRTTYVRNGKIRAQLTIALILLVIPIQVAVV